MAINGPFLGTGAFFSAINKKDYRDHENNYTDNKKCNICSSGSDNISPRNRDDHFYKNILIVS